MYIQDVLQSVRVCILFLQPPTLAIHNFASALHSTLSSSSVTAGGRRLCKYEIYWSATPA